MSGEPPDFVRSREKKKNRSREGTVCFNTAKM